jgi:hypothetical protein
VVTATGAAVLSATTKVPSSLLTVLLAQPASWTVPLAFLTMVTVSLATRRHLPAHLGSTMVRLHTPEGVDLDRGSYHPEGSVERA